MKARLDSKVESLRGQKMTFQNEGGLELTLSVPDTTDVKDTFSTLVTTIVLQQEQIVLLQATMKQVAADNANSQAKMIAWTNQCVHELRKQNESLQEKLTESNLQIDNFAYNMQGFVDGSKPDIKTSTSSMKKEILLNIQAPAVVRTKIPVVTLDPEDDSGNVKLFYTEGGGNDDDVRASTETSETEAMAIVAEEAGTSVATAESPLAATVVANVAESSLVPAPAAVAVAVAPKKNTKPSVAAKMYYNSIRKNRMPVAPSGRWRWAIRKVLRGVRTKAMKVGFTRSRVEKGNSMAERLERLEADMFSVPLQLQSFVQSETEKATLQAKADLDKLAAEVGAQHEETHKVCDALSSKIGEVRTICADLDDRLVHLSEAMEENSKKQGEEAEDNLASLNRRLVEVESTEGAKLRSRAAGLHEFVKTLKSSAEDTSARLTAAIAQSAAKTGAEGAGGADANPGDQLSALLELDTTLRETRRSLGSLEDLAFNTLEDIKAFRRDINCCATAASEGNGVSPPSPRVFPSEVAKSEMLHTCTDLEKGVQDLLGFLVEANSYWKQHDASLGQRWETLSSVIKASQAVAALSTGLEKLIDELKSKPSVDTVKSISQEAAASAVGGAIGPVRSEVRDVSERLGALKDMFSTVESAQKGLNGAIATHDTAILAMKTSSGELKTTVDELAETVTELQNRPVASGAPEATIVTLARSEIEGPPGTEGGDVDPPAVNDANGEEEKEGSGGVPIETEMDVNVIGGQYRGRGGVVVGVVVDTKGGEERTRYRVRLHPIEAVVYRQTSKRAPGGVSEDALNALRTALASIELKLSNMHREKIDANLAVKLIKDYAPGDKSKMIDAIEEAIRVVAKELEDLRLSQSTELDRVKEDMKNALLAAAAAAAAAGAGAGASQEAEPQTMVITTGQCLGCGRAAAMHSNTCLVGSYLGQQRPDSPNVLRGGFRLPVSIRPRSALKSPGSGSHPATLPGGSQTLSSTYVPSQAGNPEFTMPLPYHMSAVESSSLFLGDDQDQDQDQDQSLDRRHDHPDSQLVGDPFIPKYTSVRPKTASGAFSANQRTSGRGAAAAGLKDVGTGVVVKAVRQLQGNDTNAQLRPIRRTGFAGKKSLRAEVAYAPERYDITHEYTIPYYDAAALNG